MIPYILHVALLISVCLLFYKLLLQKETFYRLNRVVLVFCLALSFALPLIHIPQQWALRENAKPGEEASQPVITYQRTVAPPQSEAVKTQESITNITLPVTKTAPVITKPTALPVVQEEPLLQRSLKWLFYLYWIGVAAFGLNLLLQLIVLLYQAYTRPFIRDGKFRIIELSGDKAPCSFGNNIFINPEKYDWETYSQILVHEKVHIAQRHSFDILMAEFVLVLQWFNPFAWLYRTEVESNLEFLTDDAVLEHEEIERSSYQMSLLKVSAPHLSLGITTNYNQSLLKKRIVMMNAKKSNIHIMWKYFFLVPLLGILACALNDPAAYSKGVKAIVPSKIHKQWTMNTETEGSWFATIKGEKVRMEFRSDSEDHSWSSNSDFKLSEFSSLPRDKKGDFTLTREAGSITFNGKFDGDQGYGHYKYAVNKDFKAFLKEHGIGDMEDGDELAFFMVNIKREYVTMLENNGFKGISKDGLISMGALKVDAAYIKFWKDNGYENLSADELVSAKAVGITGEYLNEISKAGYKHLSFDQLISFKATGVTGKFISGLHNSGPVSVKGVKKPNAVNVGAVNVDNIPPDEVVSVKALNVESGYIDAIRKAGYPNVTLNELASMKSVGVTPQYIESLRAAGFKNIRANELISMKSVSVTPEYAKSFEAEGYHNIPANQLISMKSVGVTHEFIAGFAAAGYKNILPNDLISMKSVGVTPAYIKHFEGLGYKNIPVHELVSMKSVGVDDAFIASFANAGYKNIPVNDLVSLRAMGINPEFAKSFESVGYKNIPYRELTSLKAMNITPEFIKNFQDAGYKDVSLNTYSSLKAVGVTPEFIDGFKKIGYNDISLNEATSLKATGVTPAYVSQMRDKGFKSQDLNKYIELKNAFGEQN